MNKKSILAVALNLLAIVVPVSILAYRFGLSASVNISDSAVALTQIGWMASALVSGFLTSVVAGRLIASEENPLQKFAVRLINEIRQNNSQTRHQT